MISALLAAAAIAATPATAPPAKEPTPAELKADNAKLKQQVVYFQGLVVALRAQRDQNAEQAADLAARLQSR